MNLRPSLEADLCVNSRSNRAGCKSCESACPEQAIEWNGRLPRLSATCNSCGLCVTGCPTGAWRLKGFDWRSVVEVVLNGRGGEDSGNSVVSCSADPEADADSALPCVTALSWQVRARLADRGIRTITLRTGRCDDCAFATTAAVLEARDVCQAVLGEFAPEVVLTESRGTSRPVSPNRRRLFSTLRDSFRNTAETFAVTDERVPAGASLTNALRNLEEDGMSVRWSAIPYAASWTVDPRCTICVACSSACPSGAMRRERDGDRTRLIHDRGRCIGCEACRSACLAGLMRRESARAYELAGDCTREVVLSCKQNDDATCAACGREITSMASALCPECLKRRIYQGHCEGTPSDPRPPEAVNALNPSSRPCAGHPPKFACRGLSDVSEPTAFIAAAR